MELIHEFKNMQHLHKMIKTESTGPVDVIARKLDISIACANKLIDQLEQFGQPIRYDERAQTFLYAYGFHSQINITISAVNTNIKVPYTIAAGKSVQEHSFSFV